MNNEKLVTDVLVIGSSAAGLVAAVTGKRVYADKKFTVVTKLPKTLIPCGIPYIFGSVGSSDNDILPAEKMFAASNIEMLVDDVIKIDPESKSVRLKSGQVISYEKLVIGTGSLPLKAKWLKGSDFENVFTVPKDKGYLDQMHEKLKGMNKIITIGAGFIGVEISDELKKSGKDVLLIEKLPGILGLAFDDDISGRAEELLKERGVKIMTSSSVSEITGNGKATGVLLENGETIEADGVILAMGYKP
ncbi:MAG: FAD/NAD(P)-binding oxidoreductase, partial [Prolixibacteraceae bacterium]|nr:FAD/NAD(P)-binding oxidoreductase [Prolixibacteraceae bacterium]